MGGKLLNAVKSFYCDAITAVRAFWSEGGGEA